MGTRATMNCLQKALMSATWLTGAWLSFWGLPWAVVVEKSEIFWKTILENYGEGTFGQIFFRSRHGGDFVGLTSKLPYIKGLGCEAVWISPIFQNGNNSYHQFLRLQAGGVLSRMNIRFLLAFLEDFWCAKVRHAWLHIVRQEIGNSTRTTGLDQCCAQLGDVCHCWCSHLRIKFENRFLDILNEQQCDWQAFWWSWGVGKFCLILILIDHFCQVVMNHMGNEFYFSGYQSGQAPWRFHEEDGLREYELKFRKEPGRILTVSFGKIGGHLEGFDLGSSTFF